MIFPKKFHHKEPAMCKICHEKVSNSKSQILFKGVLNLKSKDNILYNYIKLICEGNEKKFRTILIFETILRLHIPSSVHMGSGGEKSLHRLCFVCAHPLPSYFKKPWAGLRTCEPRSCENGDWKYYQSFVLRWCTFVKSLISFVHTLFNPYF